MDVNRGTADLDCAPALEEVGMATLKCVLGRHDWHPGVDVEGQPYDKCERCGHYRYPDSDGGRFERHGELPMDNKPGGGLSAGGSSMGM